MGLVTRPNQYTAGQPIVAAANTANEVTLYNLVNGNIDNANISASANIADTKLATITTAGKVSATALTIGSQAQGDVLYASSGSAWARLGAGTSGQILKTNGTGANPAWATYSALFLTPKEYTDAADTNTSDDATPETTYQDTALSITFTVGKQGLVHSTFSARGDSSSGLGYIALLVDDTVKQEVSIPSGVVGNPVSLAWNGVLTAASHTIKIQIKGSGGGTCTLKGTNVTSRLYVSHPA